MKMATKNRREFSPHKLFWGRGRIRTDCCHVLPTGIRHLQRVLASGADKIYRDTVSTVAGLM
jgi:hypothetical protein